MDDGIQVPGCGREVSWTPPEFRTFLLNLCWVPHGPPLLKHEHVGIPCEQAQCFTSCDGVAADLQKKTCEPWSRPLAS